MPAPLARFARLPASAARLSPKALLLDNSVLMWDRTICAEVATALVTVVDPIGNIPIFISLTANHSPQERRRTLNVAALTAIAVLVAAIFAGQPMLAMFGITISSFRVAGGIILMLMALSMLRARVSPVQYSPADTAETVHGEELGVVPMGIPLLAGPGAISTVIIFAHQAGSWIDIAFLSAISVAVVAVTWVAMHLADPIRHILGKTGINVITRLFGLLLTALAVEFITGGLAQLLPGLRALK
jgi:multiple antibiotic resistance protein